MNLRRLSILVPLLLLPLAWWIARQQDIPKSVANTSVAPRSASASAGSSKPMGEGLVTANAPQDPRAMTGESLSHDFLDRIVTGQSIAFALPDGSQAKGAVEASDRNAQGIVRVRGRLTEPAAGSYFLQRQTVEGVAGPFVGHVLFDGKSEGWKIEPSEDLQFARFVQRDQDDIVCVNYQKDPQMGLFIGPPQHPTGQPLPPYQDVISLQSMPGATGVIYLDFDGEKGPHQGWGNFDAERPNTTNEQVLEIWKIVSEDYLPFNLNVTTDRKVFDNAPQGRRQHAIITPTSNATPGGAAGVALMGSFNWSGDTPCWAHYTAGVYAAHVISHEVGHTLGLYHDGTPSYGYYGGHGGFGATSWGPIMGDGILRNLDTWSKGEYAGANNQEDDLSIIAKNNNNVGFREDDTGDTLGTAEYLEIFPGNTVASEGFIGKTGDVDVFRFVTSGGQTTLNVNPVAAGPNLDILAEIVNSATGVVVTTDNPYDGINATVSANLPAGEYLLRVRGTGRGDPLGDGYTNYASLGSYTISGSVGNGVAPYRFTIAENPAGGAVIGTVAARSNHGANPLTWQIASGNESGGFAINSSTGALNVSDPAVFNYELQSLNWTDPATFELFVTITDGANPSFNETLRVVVTVTDVNDPPRFTANPYTGRPGAPGAPYAGSIIAVDEGADSGDPTYSKVSGPAWLTVAADGTLSGNPTAADMGTNTFTVRATDSLGAFSDVTLLIAIVDGAVTPYWNNPAGGAWPVAANWLGNGIANGPAQIGDFSTLDLTANATVTLDGARTIGGLKFDDTTPSHDWTLDGGSGGALTLAPSSGTPVIEVVHRTAIINAVLAGSQGFTKKGAGALTLGGANTLSGPITISQGTLALAHHNALGATSYTLGDANTGSYPTGFKVENGITSTLNLAAIHTSSFGTGQTITLNAGSGLSGDTAVLRSTLNLAGNLPLTLNATNTGGHASAQDFSGRITGTGIATGTKALVLDGSTAGLRLTFGTASNPNTFSGDVVMKGSVITQGQTFNGNAAANQNNGFRFNNVTVDWGTWTLVWGGETVGALNGYGHVSLNCQSALNNIGLTLGATNTNGEHSGNIYGGFGIEKTGTGTQTLNGVNSYGGATLVTGGTLRVNGSIAGSGVTVGSGATLAGSGTINSTVTMDAGSTLVAGDAAIGTLTVTNNLNLHESGTVALRILKSGSQLQADRIRVKGSLGVAYRGTLIVTAGAGSEALSRGDKFTLFSKAAGIYSGSFSNFQLPALGAGLMWETSQLTVDGSIQVTSATIVENPAFSPDSGSMMGPVNITIATVSSGATIHYTTDGSDPLTSSTAKSGASRVTVTLEAPSNKTIKAYASKAGFANSAVVSATYDVYPPTPGSITSQPVDQAPVAGGNASFSVGMAGTGPFIYQWRFNGTAYWGISSNPTLNLSNVGSGAVGSYDCVITSPNETLTSNTATLTISATPVRRSGGLRRDAWHGVGGTAVADLTTVATYPYFPSATSVVTSAEASNYGDNYGQRLSGWIKPPLSGAYRFFIASDDSSQLWLSTDESAVNKVKIADYSGTTGFRSYSTGAQSAVVNLVAGQKYYIEILHKEGGGGDHVSVAWQMPGEAAPTDGSAPIEGVYLEYDNYDSLLTNHWKLDEASGNICFDSIRGANATLNNGPSRIAGRFGNAVSFNGVNQYAIAEAKVSQSSYAVSLWFRTDYPDGGIFSAGNANESEHDWHLLLHEGRIASSMNGGIAASGEGTNYADGQWHHLVHTFGGVVGGEKIYMDGIEVASSEKTSSPITSQTHVRIGCSRYWSENQFFNGKIDDVKLFNAGMSAGEVAAIYSSGVNPAPQMGAQAFAISEGAAVGTTVGTMTATDANAAQSLTYSIMGGNAGGRFAVNPSTGEITVASPLNFEISETYILTISAADNGTPAQSVTATATINLVNVNEPPVFASNPVIGSNAGSDAPYTGVLTASDPDVGDTVTYAKLGGPSWLSIAADGSLSGIPVSSNAGVNDFPIRATDGHGAFTDVTLRIVVLNLHPVWINASGGSWLTSGNWQNGSIADGTDVIADFATRDLAANASVSLNGSRIIGGMKFADTTPSNNWTLDTGSGGPLTLAVSSGTPAVQVVNQTATLNTVLAGNQGLAKTGAGTLILSAANSYTGGTFANEGTLVVKAPSNADWVLPGGAATVASGATLKLDLTAQTTQFGKTTLGATTIASGGAIDLHGTVDNVDGHYLIQSWDGASGGGTIRLAGGGSIAVWTATNPLSGFTGLLDIQNGRFACNVASTATLGGNFDVSLAPAGKLDLRSGHFTIDALDGVSGSVVHKSWTGDTINFTIGNNNGSGNFAGVMSGTNYNVIKTGTGTQTLGGANTYAGTTAVNGGTLLVNGSLANSAVTVAAAGTLGGTGTLGGAVTNNGTLAPGSNGVGNLTINNAATLAGGSKITWDITNWTGAAGTGWDKLTASSLNLTATSASRITLNLTGLALANFSETSKTFVIAQTTSGITGFSADKFTVDTGGLTTPRGTWAVQQSGNNLLLAYTAQTNPDSNSNGILDTWEIAKFGNANPGANPANADPDKDGLSNLMEYALDTHPATSNTSPITYDLETRADGKHLRITVPKNSNATNLTYIVETSSDLKDWSSLNTTIESGDSNPLVVRDDFVTTTSARRFTRLRVEVLP